MKARFLLFVLAGCLLLAGCVLPPEFVHFLPFGPTITGDAVLYAVKAYPGSATLTPFQPVENTTTYTPSASGTLTLTPTSTETLTCTTSLTSTWTGTPTNTSTITLTPTIFRTFTVTSTPIASKTPTITFKPTLTRTSTRTGSPANTSTAPLTPTITATPTITYTATITWTPSTSPTPSLTSTITNTLPPTASPTITSTGTTTFTPTASFTASPYLSPTFTVSPTATETPTPSFTPTVTPTPTNTRTPGPTYTPTATRPGCNPVYNSGYEDQIVTLINQTRVANGLSALRVNNSLMTSAREHSTDMAVNNYVSHTGSDGSTPWQRMLRAGYVGRWGGENIYGGYNTSPTQAFTWWMNSTPHRDNILGQYYRDVGVGYAYCSTSTYRNAYTINFGTP